MTAPDCFRLLGRRVVVTHEHPPIPVRGFDYRATFEGHEPGEPQGFGATPVAALEDLRDTAIAAGWKDELMEELTRSARNAVANNVRHTHVSLGLLLADWYPDATDQQIDAAVEEALGYA